jgi:hypothetical protein
MTEPQQQQPQPGVQDAQQVGQAATDAALAASTPAQARTDAAAAAQRVGAEKGIEIGEKEAKVIADAVVSAMEARGAFDAPLENVSPPPAPAPAAGDAAVAPAGAAPAAVAVAPEQPPRKRSFAQKFLGE